MANELSLLLLLSNNSWRKRMLLKTAKLRLSLLVLVDSKLIMALENVSIAKV